jgi:hypothetical protein
MEKNNFNSDISLYWWTRCSVVARGTTLQPGRSRIPFLMRSLEFSIDIIFPPLYGSDVDSRPNGNECQEYSFG